MTRLRLKIAAAVLTVMIGGQLAVSAYAALHKLRGNSISIHWQTFPWFDYPMYSMSAGPPVQTNVPRLYADFADGRRVEVTPEMTGYEYFAWRFNILERLVADPIPTDDIAELDDIEAAQRRALAVLVEEHRDTAATLATKKVMEAQPHADRPARFVVERDVYRLEGRTMVKTRAVQQYELAVGESATPPSALQGETGHD